MLASEFERLAGAALRRLESALEASGADLDIESKGEGLIEIEFVGGGKLIVNRHGAAQEIWVAAKSGGFHFRWTAGAWIDTRHGEELAVCVSKLIQEHSGQHVELKI